MTIDEIKKLSDRELDARLIEVMGWDFGLDDGVLFTQSRDAIAPLEEKTIGEVPYAYENALSDAVMHGAKEAVYKWPLLITASARHRAEAILLCWETDSLNGRT